MRLILQEPFIIKQSFPELPPASPVFPLWVPNCRGEGFGVVGSGAGCSGIVVLRLSEKILLGIALSEQTKNSKIVCVDFDGPFSITRKSRFGI